MTSRRKEVSSVVENSPAVSESPLKNTRRGRPSGQVSFICPAPGSAAFAASCPADAEAVCSRGLRFVSCRRGLVRADQGKKDDEGGGNNKQGQTRNHERRPAG